MDGWKPKQRHYLHFDVRLDADRIGTRACDPAFVAAHAFWPLIAFEVEKHRRASEPRQAVKKVRVIMYAAHADAAIFSRYAHLLAAPYEEHLAAQGFSEVVCAYRAGAGSAASSASEVFARIAAWPKATVVKLDVAGFFDSIRQDDIYSAWKRLLGVPKLPDDHYRVFRGLTRFSWVKREDVRSYLSGQGPAGGRIATPDQFDRFFRAPGLIHRHRGTAGIPQGNPLSAMMSNLVMLEFDRTMNTFASAVGGLYRRYSDDILFAAPELDPDLLIQDVEARLGALGMSINQPKTRVVRFGPDAEQGSRIDFLGLSFDGRQVGISHATLSRFYASMIHGVKARASRVASQVREGSIVEGSTFFTRALWLSYSHVGKRNFYQYVRLVDRVTGSKLPRRQLRGHAKRLKQELHNAQMFVGGIRKSARVTAPESEVLLSARVALPGASSGIPRTFRVMLDGSSRQVDVWLPKSLAAMADEHEIRAHKTPNVPVVNRTARRAAKRAARRVESGDNEEDF
jgi:RNA-directed DNA polymerase